MSERAFLTAILFCLGAGWGLTMPLTKIAVSAGHHPMGLLFWQVTTASIVLGAIVLARGGMPWRRAGAFGIMLTVALTGTIIPNSFSYRAAVHLPAGVLAVLVASVPMFALPIALGLGIDRLSLRRVVGLCLGLLGVALIALPDAQFSAQNATFWVLIGLIPPFFYAIESNIVARFGLFGLDPIEALFGASVIGMTITGPYAIASGVFVNLTAGIGGAEWALLASSLIHAIVYSSYVWLVGRAGPVFSGQVAYVVTGSGVFWSMVILGERYPATVWIAALVVLLGISFVRPRSKQVLAPDSSLTDTRDTTKA